MSTPIPGFQGENGTWICRNGGYIGFGDSEFEAFEDVMRGSSIFLSTSEWGALYDYLQTKDGQEWAKGTGYPYKTELEDISELFVTKFGVFMSFIPSLNDDAEKVLSLRLQAKRDENLYKKVEIDLDKEAFQELARRVKEIEQNGYFD